MKSEGLSRNFFCCVQDMVHGSVDLGVLHSFSPSLLNHLVQSCFSVFEQSVHMQKHIQHFGIDFAPNKQLDHSARSVGGLDSIYHSIRIYIRSWVELLNCRSYRLNALLNAVLGTLVQRISSRIRANTDAPFLKKCRADSHDDDRTIHGQSPPRGLSSGLRRPSRLLRRCQHFLIHSVPLAACAVRSPVIQGFAR